ncbi:copper chaperone PCu(A)C [Roseomonas elaeocarpi]|uniref:Copper chaperone PCu(A)C n=1 Tax=Roseomonas elaeocarpi TaxID=907779 RepID=A0ABV6JTF1_9PROT
MSQPVPPLPRRATLRRLMLGACLAVAATFPAARAQEGGAARRDAAGDIAVTAAWSRPAVAGGTGAGFLTIRNSGGTADRLVGADSPAAAAVELHESTSENGVMRMRPLAAVELPPGGAATLSPGGMHLMLLRLRAPLRLGDRVPITLHFARAGAVPVELVVRTSAPPAP